MTVCEEAGCPNIYECWNDGTATFMINGSRCTRACGFCLVDTRKPEPLDADEPRRVAEATVELGPQARRDHVRRPRRSGRRGSGCVRGNRRRHPRRAARHERRAADLGLQGRRRRRSHVIFDARPDVLNHNLETVARLQRAVRPSAGYARSLAVLARAKAAGLTTKSGLMVGLGETHDEVMGALRDLRGVGVDIATIGQYLRPTAHHLPVARWWTPAEFDALRADAQALGFAHVECSPLTRSSYHARTAADAALASSQ